MTGVKNNLNNMSVVLLLCFIGEGH